MWSSSMNVSVPSCMCVAFAGPRFVPPTNCHRIRLTGDFGPAYIRGWLPRAQSWVITRSVGFPSLSAATHVPASS
jgi:hypothetical protein